MTSRVLSILCITVAVAMISTTKGRTFQKRQIYREQVLPHAGGKIPDTAFETGRLFLNHLQKEGIAVPDGIVLQQRNPQVYPYLNKNSRTVYKVALSSDGRYIPNEGRYFHDSPPSVETTYLVPQIHDYPERKPSVLSIYKQLHTQNTLLNQSKLQPKMKSKKKTFLYLSPYSKNFSIGSDNLKPQTQSLKLLNDPLDILTSNNFVPSFESSPLFKEFDNLFNSFHPYSLRTSYKL